MNDDEKGDVGFRLSQCIDYITASEILGILPKDFNGSMWDSIDYTKYLEDIIGHDVKVLSYKTDSFYAQGESNMVFTEIVMKNKNEQIWRAYKDLKGGSVFRLVFSDNEGDYWKWHKEKIS